MKMIIDVADDIPLEKMQKMFDSIEKDYDEYVVDMGWVIKGKFVRELEKKEEKIKQESKDPFDTMFGPAKTKKEDPFNNIMGSDKTEDKDKKDDSLGFF